jgi:hypothetical protein
MTLFAIHLHLAIGILLALPFRFSSQHEQTIATPSTRHHRRLLTLPTTPKAKYFCPFVCHPSKYAAAEDLIV